MPGILMRRRLTPIARFSIDSRERVFLGIAWWFCSPLPPGSAPLRISLRKSSRPPYKFNTFNSTLEDGSGLRLRAKEFLFATRGSAAADDTPRAWWPFPITGRTPVTPFWHLALAGTYDLRRGSSRGASLRVTEAARLYSLPRW